MIQLTESDKKQAERFKLKARKMFPSCRLDYDEDFNIIVVDDNDNNILKDFVFPATRNPIKAWEYASVAARTTQQFNRTHPLRCELDTDSESKQNRLSERQRMIKFRKRNKQK